MVDVESKVLPCLFLSNVLCSYVKSESTGVLDRCLKCKHYLRFLQIMHDEDMKVMDEIEEMRRHDPYE